MTDCTHALLNCGCPKALTDQELAEIRERDNETGVSNGHSGNGCCVWHDRRALLAHVDAMAAALAAHQQANTDLRAHCETAETEVESLRREVEERESELARLREAAKAAAEKFLMLRSYLGHEDQDANHAWMADQMREASNALDDALSAALGTGEAGKCPCGEPSCGGVTDGANHQCGGPKEACAIPGCPECGARPGTGEGDGDADL